MFRAPLRAFEAPLEIHSQPLTLGVERGVPQHTRRNMNEKTDAGQPNMLEILERLKGMPGQRIRDAILELETPVASILVPNFWELDRHLEWYERGTVAWMPQSEEHERLINQYLRETLRLIHNLVAATKTVVDHTRNILRREWPDESSAVRTEFEAEKRVFTNDGRLMVMQGLRNFVLHYKLPAVLANDTWTPETGMVSRIRISTASLLESKEVWTSEAKHYLRNAGDTIELRPLAREYVERALDLQNRAIKSIETHEAGKLGPWKGLAEQIASHWREVLSRAGQPAEAPEHRTDSPDT